MSERSGRLSRLAALGLQDMPIEYPLRDNSIFGFEESMIRQDARATRIVVHPQYPKLVQAFLAHKRAHGSSVEKRVYGSDPALWSWKHQVARLVDKRPLAFLTSADMTRLRNGHGLPNAPREWDNVGTEADLTGPLPENERNAVLSLDEYLSYDEIMLGSLLGVSGPSHFINDGNRYNMARKGQAGTFEPRGVIVGLVGARFERPDHMDSALILAPVSNPRQHPELTALFQDFFRSAGWAAREPGSMAAFHDDAYKARIRVTADILLLEANSRAMAEGKDAYVYVVGLGLGVWLVDTNQPRLYVEAFAEAIDALGAAGSLDSVRTIEFAWIDASAAARQAVIDVAATYDIHVQFSKRNPAAKLAGEEANQLLVLSYAWDGNSFPGNEYWLGSLAASGDPAAAAMSTIAELHNPIMNPDFLDRVEDFGGNGGQ